MTMTPPLPQSLSSLLALRLSLLNPKNNSHSTPALPPRTRPRFALTPPITPHAAPPTRTISTAFYDPAFHPSTWLGRQRKCLPPFRSVLCRARGCECECVCCKIFLLVSLSCCFLRGCGCSLVHTCLRLDVDVNADLRSTANQSCVFVQAEEGFERALRLFCAWEKGANFACAVEGI
jgi:hypothetical protein